MADETAEGVTKLTGEQEDAYKKAAAAEKARLEREKEMLDKEMDEGGGFKALQAAIRMFIPGKEKTEKDDGDEKKEVPKTPWQLFAEYSRNMGDYWEKDFLPALKRADLGPDLKSKIAKLCISYFELLQETHLALAGCRHATEAIANTMHSVLKVVSYAINNIKNLDNDKKREQIADELSKKVGQLSTDMKDDKHKTEMIALQEKWKQMSESISALYEEFMAYLKDFQKKAEEAKQHMSVWEKAGMFFVRFVGQAAMTVTGGLAAPALDAFGQLFDMIGLHELSAATKMVKLEILMPSVMGELVKVRDVTIRSIQKGLDHISCQAVQVSVMLHEIVAAFEELAKLRKLDDYGDSPFQVIMDLEDGGNLKIGGTPLKELCDSLREANADLAKLVEAIQGSEDAIKVELREYPQKIHPKLLEMLNT